MLFISGSRNREGRTARIVKAIEKGVKDARGQTEVVFLTELKLERCRQNIDMKIPMLEMTGKWLAGKPASGSWPPPPTPAKK